MVETEKSEFGKGLVICLVKFAEHAMELRRFIEMAEKSGLNKNHYVDLWASGASDHLYDIEVPVGVEWDAIRKKVKELQDKGLEMGHGFTGNVFSVEDAYGLHRLTQEIAILIDEKLGLKPDSGMW